MLDEMITGPDGHGHYGPTGVGDDWVRMGPFKVFLDGGVLIGTAYMREPWGVSDTYQITDPAYRGLLNVKPELLNALYLAAARRGWRLTAHCTGEAAVDVLLDCYENIQKVMDIHQRRFEICHANFQSAEISPFAGNWASWPTCSRPGFTRTAPACSKPSARAV